MQLGKILVAATVALACTPAAARAATPTVVAVGDSAISGEAGRWAGNTNGDPARTDALGPTAYYDAGSGEAIAGCHRSKSAEVLLGGGVTGVNLACSGARTYTHTGDDGAFKPGLDFDPAGGQALALQKYAKAHPGDIKAVVVLIGANNYGFATVVQDCVEDWLLSPSWWKNYCSDDSTEKAMFSASNVATVTSQVKQAYLNIHQAMTNAGYADSSYTILAQTYSSPLPPGALIRYPESGFSRQATGGCGVWNNDADWSNTTVVGTFNSTIKNAIARSRLTNVKLLDMQNALVGHRLCEKTDGLLEERGIASWRTAGAVDASEWVEQIRTVTTLLPPYQLQEDGHPDYWGQLALRNCLRQAYNAGAVRGGSCTHGTGGLDSRGEPNMTFP
jgi:hypothetical protein